MASTRWLIQILLVASILFLLYSSQDSFVVSPPNGRTNDAFGAGGQALPEPEAPKQPGFDSVGFASQLYRRYGAEIAALIPKADEFCSETVKGKLKCLSNTIETELAYMRVRHYKPRLIWEIAPRYGYSTLWLLSALFKNAEEGAEGHLVSFDYDNVSLAYVPHDLRSRWTFRKGVFDAASLETNGQRTPAPDYVHLDAGHSFKMGSFYRDTFFSYLLAAGKPIQISLHDVYNPQFWSDPHPKRNKTLLPDWMPNEEGIVILDWLAYQDPPQVCRLFTFAETRQPEAQKRVLSIRNRAVGGKPYHGGFESTIFWEMNCK